MQGKKGLIMGVANDHSLAWGIAKKLKGADLAFTYQSDILLKRVAPLAKTLDSDFCIPCDVSDAESVKNVFNEIKKKWGKLDFVVHAIAFADKDSLTGRTYE